MSDDSSNRALRYEIIKYLYSSATVHSKPNPLINDMANELQLPYNEVLQAVRNLISLDYVWRPHPLHATLKHEAMQVMDRIPQPRDYDDFITKMSNSHREFGESGKIERSKKNHWYDNPIVKSITTIGSCIGIISSAYWLFGLMFAG